MLPFFRKIRFKLAQDNQFLKYSRYAIGEIVLVVIGILIALQINNWNEERKKSEKKRFYIKALQEDLKKDTAQIRLFIREIDEYEPIYRNLKVIIEKEGSTIDTLIDRFINRTNYTPELEPQNNSTIKSLLSTGEIEIFNESQSSVILDFYKDLEWDYNFIYDWYERVDVLNHEFWKEYGWLTKDSNWFIYNRARDNIDPVKFSINYDYYITMRDFWLPIMRERSEMILKHTEEMIKTTELMKN